MRFSRSRVDGPVYAFCKKAVPSRRPLHRRRESDGCSGLSAPGRDAPSPSRTFPRIRKVNSRIRRLAAPRGSRFSVSVLLSRAGSYRLGCRRLARRAAPRRPCCLTLIRREGRTVGATFIGVNLAWRGDRNHTGIVVTGNSDKTWRGHWVSQLEGEEVFFNRLLDGARGTGVLGSTRHPRIRRLEQTWVGRFPNLKPSTTTISLRLPAPLAADLKTLANKRDVHNLGAARGSRCRIR